MSGAAVPPWPGESFTCADCGTAYAELPVPSVADALPDAVAAFAEAVRAASDEALRARPADGGWSVIEYVCHVRDVHVAGTIRLHRVRTEVDPVLEPMRGDLRARRFDYRRREPEPVLAELAAATAGVRAEARRTTDWERAGVRSSDAGEERRTARWLLRQVVHETVHHRRDVDRLLR